MTTKTIHPLTENQRIASNPHISAWVNASAGAGKTQTLAHRMIRLMLSGATPASILCITYTKSASATMHNRIMDTLGQWATMTQEAIQEECHICWGMPITNEEAHNAKGLLYKVLDTPYGLRIQTIHSFCQSLLERFPMEAGIQSNVKVLSEEESKNYKQIAKEYVLKQGYTERDSTMASIITIIKQENISEKTLTDIIDKNISDSTITITQTPSMEEIYKIHGIEALLTHKDSSEIYEKTQSHPKDSHKDQWLKSAVSMKKMKGATPSKSAETIEAYWTLKNHTHWRAAFLTKENTPIAHLKNARQEHPMLQEETDRLLSIIKTAKNLQTAKQAYVYTVLAGRIQAHYEKLKKERGYIDYNDMIDKAKSLLERENASWVRYKLDSQINHLLLDEAQDTSPKQWEIINKILEEFLSGDGAITEKNKTIFVVGDEKQSIYRFQGADYAIFQAQKIYIAERLQCIDKPFEDVALNDNFRSKGNILNMVDTIFTSPRRKEGVSSTTITHKAHKGDGGYVEVWPTLTLTDANDDTETNASVLLAEKVSQEINKRYKEGIKAKDILILYPKRTGKAFQSFYKALRQYLGDVGITLGDIDKISLKEHIAVMDLEALLKLMYQPNDDLTLACVLKSPLFQQTDDDLMHYAYNRGNQSLWSIIEERNQKIAACLNHWQNKSKALSPNDFLRYVLHEQGYHKQFAARLGESCQMPIQTFLLWLDQAQIRGIQALASTLEALEQTQAEIKQEINEQEDKVQCSSIHNAKGREARCVFVLDLDYRNTNKKTYNYQGYIIPKNEYILKDQIQEEENANEQEKNRLLYVALTRAKEYLYVASAKNYNEPLWSKPINDKKNADALTALDEVLSAYKIEDNNRWNKENFYKDYHYAMGISKPYAKKDHEKSKAKIIPPYVLTKPPIADETAVPLNPSNINDIRGIHSSPLEEGEKENVEKGILLHRILEWLPGNWERAESVKKENPSLSADIDNILNNKEIRKLLSKKGLSEIPITGLWENHVVVGRIDRLIIEDDCITIIDYKATAYKNEGSIKESYKKQLEIYKQLIKKIMPDKKIKKVLIFTTNGICKTVA